MRVRSGDGFASGSDRNMRNTALLWVSRAEDFCDAVHDEADRARLIDVDDDPFCPSRDITLFEPQVGAQVDDGDDSASVIRDRPGRRLARRPLAPSPVD